MKLQQVLLCLLMLIVINSRGSDNNRISIFNIVPLCQESLKHRRGNLFLPIQKQNLGETNSTAASSVPIDRNINEPNVSFEQQIASTTLNTVGSYELKNRILDESVEMLTSNILENLPGEMLHEMIWNLSLDRQKGICLYLLMRLRNCNKFFRNLTYDNPYLWRNIVRNGMQLKLQTDPSYTYHQFVLEKMEEARKVNYRAIGHILATIYNQNSLTELYKLHSTTVAEGELFRVRRKKCFEYKKEAKNSAKYISKIDKYPYSIKEYTAPLVIKKSLPTINCGIVAQLLHKQKLTDDIYSLIERGYSIEGLVETIMYQEDTPEMLKLLDTTIERQALKIKQLPDLILTIIKTNKPYFLKWLLQHKDKQGNCFAKLAIMENKPNQYAYSYITTVISYLGYKAKKNTPEEFLLYKERACKTISLLKENGADPHEKGGVLNLNAFETLALLENAQGPYGGYYNPALAAEIRLLLQ